MLVDILQVLFGVLVGGVIGFFVSRKYMMSYFEKNPPISEDMIRALMAQMGRTASQKQINQMMAAMKTTSPNKKLKKK